MALVFFFVAAVGAAVAANSGNAPLLVPYTMNVVAGTSQYSTASTPAIVSGYGGDIGFNGSAGFAVPFVTSGLGTSSAVIVNGATLNRPDGFAVDSVGNIYIADGGNDLIREVNYQTGLINIVAGATPTSCAAKGPTTLGAYSCSAAPGCADGVLAYGANIGSGIVGVAVDSFGNVYFSDTASRTVSVVYRGGTRVADFINRVNPAAVAYSGWVVQVGYVYHIAGEINLGNPVDSGATCVGYTSNPVTTAVVDNAPAFENTAIPGATPGATLNGVNNISLDSAGNIYLEDTGTGTGTVRVINTQETAQTFFQYTIPPGYMRAILNCSASLTTPCPAVSTTFVGTGINGPANALVFLHDNTYASADAYGNVFELNTKGASPGIYAAVAYAGGAPLTSLLTVEAPQLSSIYSATETAYPVPPTDSSTPNELPLAYGNAYIVGGQPATSVLPGAFLSISAVTSEELVIRPVSWNADTFGTEWYEDYHFQEIFRIDQYSGIATGITWSDAITNSPVRGGSAWTGVPGLSGSDKIQNLIVTSNGTTINGNISNYNTNSPASFTNLWNCVYGNSSGGPWVYGPQTYDPEGDGCPGQVTRLNGAELYTTNDGLGNLYAGDSADEVIHEFTVGTQFPATPVGTATPLAQEIQVHFDASNIPVTGGVAGTSPVADGPSLGFTTTSFTITPAGGDFSFDTTTQEFPFGSLLVPITGLPLGWGENPTTPNFGMYPTSAMLTAGTPALPTCTQLGVAEGDNSWDCLVNVKFAPTGPGMRTGQLVATTANGSVYNFQLTGIGTGPQLAIDGGSQTTVAATGLGTTSSVAVTSGGTVYIADPTNNRIVVEPVGGGAQTTITTVTGVTPATLSGPMGVAVDAANNVYIADTGNNRILEYNPITASATQLGNYLWIPGPQSSNAPGSSVTATTAPPQYTFKAPQGLAVDQWGNVYVADTGNGVVVEIPSNTNLGGATPLLQFPGAPQFTAPVAVAIGPGPLVTQNGLIQNTSGFIYVADPQNAFGEVVRLPPGGGDLQPAASGAGSALNIPAGSSFPLTLLFGGTNITSPNGVAVDAAGNVYVSDSVGNAVWEAPATGPPNGNPFALNFSGLSSPAGIALDANGNVYVADTGNNRIVVVNRQNPVVSFGTVPKSMGTSGVAGTPAGCPILGSDSPCTGVLTVSNIGNQPVTLASTFVALSGSGAASYSVSSTCKSPMPVGTTCTISPLFTPPSTGSSAAILTVNGTQSIALTANGALPPTATPTFSIPAGLYTSALAVSISDATAGATIYYTTNGTTPTTSSSVYRGGAITVSSSETLEAIATASGYSTSAVATAAYTIQAATPTFSVLAGSYPSAQTVTISDATAGATIYYTTDGTPPTTSSTVYSGAITVSSSETLKAIATATGYYTSAVATAGYLISPLAVGGMMDWTWMGGSSTVPNTNDGSGGQSGVYGTLGTPAAGNIPGSRYSAVSWIDSSGHLWLFGGQGYDASGKWGFLNDLWEYQLPTTTPTVMVTPSSTSIIATQGLSVTVAVSAGSDNLTPTGSVILTGGGYTSPSTALSGGSATFNLAAGSLAAGSDIFTASYTPDSSNSSTYSSSSGTSSAVVVSQVTPTITFTVPNHTYGDAPFTLAATSNSGAPITYSVVSGPATISASTLSITGAGPVTVQAAQIAAGNYTAGSQNASFTVAPLALTAAIIGNPTKTYDGITGAALTSSNYQLSPLVGSDVISVTQPSGVYASATAGPEGVTAALSSVNFSAVSGLLSNYILPTAATGPGTIAQAATSSTITWNTPAAITYGTALSVTQLNASSTVAGTFSYSPVSGGVLTAGSHTLSVTFTPTDTTDYTTATATVTLVVNQATQTITFIAPTSPVTYGVPPITLSATASSGLPVTISVLSGPASISGNILTITGVGTVVVAADQAGDADYAAAREVTHRIVVKQIEQTISFTAPTSPVTYGVAPITLSATASSGLPVTFSVLSGPASISGNILTITGVGTVVVAADQTGDADYAAAREVTHRIVVKQ